MIEVEIPSAAFLPKYRKLLRTSKDLIFLWGGRDAGRSYFVGQKLLIDCLTHDYFRCVLVKKTFASIKDSQWQNLKDIATRWGVEHLFRFKENPLGIECVNGNKFIARGCDNPENIKSIKDPTHAWYEEGNQLALEDFITVSTTLRSEKTRIQQWFTFNPESRGDFNEFWLYKSFFKGKPNTFEAEWVLELPSGKKAIYEYEAIHSTYVDNPFCTAQRAAFLEQLISLSGYLYSVYTKGEWGNEKVDSPFVYTFRREKHVGKTVWRPAWETYLSFDFNRDPITCGVYQHIDGVDYGVESINLQNSDIYKMCDYIKETYPGAMFLVTGDATGKASSALISDNRNYYTVIKEKLGLTASQIRTPNINPKVSENRMLVNAAFHHGQVLLDEFRCKHLIFDLENVCVTPDGDIDKGDRSNPRKRADHIDHYRYYLNTFRRDLLRM